MSNLPAPGVYNVDPVHSTVSFIARHLVAAKVRGNFTEFSGAITIGDTIEASSVVAEVQASADFLDQEHFPTLNLKSTKITAKGGDKYELLADLTVRGTTKPVTFQLEYLGTGPSMAPGVNVTGFEVTGEIDRREFGVNFEGTLENGSLVVGNKIGIEIAVEAHQAA